MFHYNIMSTSISFWRQSKDKAKAQEQVNQASSFPEKCPLHFLCAIPSTYFATNLYKGIKTSWLAHTKELPQNSASPGTEIHTLASSLTSWILYNRLHVPTKMCKKLGWTQLLHMFSSVKLPPNPHH
ncbi:unnamed protein product [Ilex paraguariensis]|uniref:Uncharacterized protein n=1 Tax=Ilex paraguariensis TaxID=185542 RepID=A0ABC8U3P3_9AQUA